jgi:acyl carrier protein
MEKKIINLVKKEFTKFKIKKNFNISKLKLKDINGWDSLSSINFFLKLQKMSKKKIDIIKMSNLKSLDDVIGYITKKK